MFLELPADLPLLDYEGQVVEPSVLKKFDSRIAMAVVAAVVVAYLFLAIGAITGVGFSILIASGIVFTVGLIGAAVVLDQRAKVARLAEGYETSANALRSAAKANKEIVSRYYAFKTNVDAIAREVEQRESDKLANALADASALATASKEAIARAQQLESSTNVRLQKIIDRFLADTTKNLKARLTVNNYATSRERFQKAVDFCGKHGFAVARIDSDRFLAELKSDFEELLRTQAKREEQARIKERIRDQEKARIELEKEMKRVAEEQDAIQRAIAEAMARTHDEHSAEVEALRAKLAEAEAKSQRTLSMAQQTKAGNVYVISNIGSFGESVFKIGLTRRLDPLDRVKELGDASVPFPFDVHMMVYSDDAPALEALLHRKFNHERLNRVNLRKEFFRVGIEEIAKAVEEAAGKIEYIAEPEALEYRESQRMTDEDIDTMYANTEIETLDDDDD